MAKLIRYSLATIFFATSVGCLALWGWTASRSRSVQCLLSDFGPFLIDVQLCNGEAKVAAARYPYSRTRPRVAPAFKTLDGLYLMQFDRTIKSQGRFAAGARSIYFPLWYPALVLALTGIGVLRVRRQFSIRSAMVCLTVVAALLGMVVAL